MAAAVVLVVLTTGAATVALARGSRSLPSTGTPASAVAVPTTTGGPS